MFVFQIKFTVLCVVNCERLGVGILCSTKSNVLLMFSVCHLSRLVPMFHRILECMCASIQFYWQFFVSLISLYSFILTFRFLNISNGDDAQTCKCCNLPQKQPFTKPTDIYIWNINLNIENNDNHLNCPVNAMQHQLKFLIEFMFAVNRSKESLEFSFFIIHLFEMKFNTYSEIRTNFEIELSIPPCVLFFALIMTVIDIPSQKG